MAIGVEALVKPALLIWARETSGLSAEEAAAKVGVAPEKLAAWERGDARPTVVQLRELARVYRRPFAVFYLPEPPQGFSVPHDYRTVADAAVGRMSAELRAELRRIQFQREVALDLSAEEGAPEADWIGTATVRTNVESLAETIRERLGVTIREQSGWTTHYQALRHWRAALESLHVLVCQLDGVEVSETRGVSIAHRVQPVIAANGKDSPTARAFTLFHELGHLLLNGGALCDLDEVTSPSSADQRTERFCNAFAAAVLLPKQEVVSYFGADALSRPREWTTESLHDAGRHFNVSREAVLRRLVTLGAATLEYFFAMRQRFQAEYAETERKRKEREATSGGPSPAVRAYLRTGPAFARIVLDAYDREDITSSDLTDYLGVRFKHVSRVRELAFAGVEDEGAA
jgi:Zn-dependent peptidase ImmA (M78 family)/transcriptional regulator with XRE-family HTH domain